MAGQKGESDARNGVGDPPGMMTKWWNLLAAAVLAAHAAPGAAQGLQPNPEREPAREVEAERDAREAARAAGEKGDLGPEVRFDQVLADPDDVPLNLRYVEQRIRAGDLRAAAATLERVLAVEPDNARARLLYGLVLLRLDNLAEAERELLAIRPLPMPDSLRAEIDGYLKQIEQRRRLTRYTASLSLGGHFDTNRDAAPRSHTRRALGITGTADHGQDDLAVLGIGTFEVRHDLGYQAKHDVFGRATLLVDEQIRLSQQDLKALFLEAGGSFRLENLLLIPSVNYTQLELNRQDYLYAGGLKLRAERRLDSFVQLQAEGQMQYQDFDAVTRFGSGKQNQTSTAPLADEQSGYRLDLEAGITLNLATDHQFTLTAGWTNKEAKENYQAYAGGRLTASHLWLLGGGQFLLGSVSMEALAYDRADPLVDPDVPRRDTLYRARLTYGVPFATLFGDGLPAGIGDMVWTGTGELLVSDGNLPNYTYANVRLQALVTKRWEF